MRLNKSLSLALALVAGATAAHADFVYGNYDNGPHTCSIVGWTGSAATGVLTIPSTTTYNGTSYSVSAIASNAIENMPTVTEIVIPSSVMKIGEVSRNTIAKINNFNNCPNLKKFTVTSGNVFASTSTGLLTSSDGATLYRVPEGVSCPSTIFEIPSAIKYLSTDALSGVSTIVTLRIPTSVNVGASACFYNMPKLRAIETVAVSGVKNIEARDGMLYSYNALVACPPKYSSTSVTIQASCDMIYANAFRNCKDIKVVIFGGNNVTDIGEQAFANSGITSITLPTSVKNIGDAICYGCSDLTTASFRCNLSSLPARTFENCTSLYQVTYNGTAPKSLMQSAFKGCSSLADYPFNNDIAFEGDSVFANCGFVNLTFPTGKLSANAIDRRAFGAFTFSGNQKLKKIDLSGIEADDIRSAFMLNQGVFTNCPNIETVIFPSLLQAGGESQAVMLGEFFNNNLSLKTIVLGGAISTYSSPLFSFTSGTFTPSIYWRAGKYASDASLLHLDEMFFATSGANFRPTVYCEATNPGTHYVLKGASNYYVPARGLQNYLKALDAGIPVNEMFSIMSSDYHGILNIQVQSLVSGVVITELRAGNNVMTTPNNKTFDTGQSATSTTPVEITYYVNGTKFTTSYTVQELMPTAVDSVEADSEAIAPEYFDLQGRRVNNPAKGSLYIERRGSEFKKIIL